MTNSKNYGLAAVYSLVLSHFPDAELHALNLGIEWESPLAKENISFNLAREYDLIDQRGNFRAIEELKLALTLTVNERARAGGLKRRRP